MFTHKIITLCRMGRRVLKQKHDLAIIPARVGRERNGLAERLIDFE